MVFSDIGQVNEIDNELILFRELLNIESEYYHSLLISQGGRITQHMVEFLYRSRTTVRHNIYDSTFEFFLNKCEFIPPSIRKVILEINNYRKDAVYSLKDEYELHEFILDYLKAFKVILVWFYKYSKKRFGFNRFSEIKSTFEAIKIKINNPEKINAKRVEFESDLENNFPTGNDITEIKSAVFELLDHVKTIDKRTQNIDDTTQDTNKIAHNTNDTVHTIDNKVDQLQNDLRQLTADISEYKKEVHELLNSTPFDEEEREKIINEFTNKCIKKIRNSFEITSVDDYEIEKENLIESLGENAWNKLSEQSKTFLITAKITFNKINDLEDIMDYSGVCLLVTKSLEVELSKRFFKGFKKSFKDKPKSEYHTSLLDRNKKYILKDNRCTLGTITYIFGQNEDKQPKDEYESNLSKVIDYSKSNYFKDLNYNDIRDKIIYYGELVETIRVKYRNPAAHTKELKCPKAKDCFNYVIDAKQVLKIMLDSFDK